MADSGRSFSVTDLVARGLRDAGPNGDQVHDLGDFLTALEHHPESASNPQVRQFLNLPAHRAHPGMGSLGRAVSHVQNLVPQRTLVSLSP